MITARVLTVRQPWAWAIAMGSKRVENRSRPTSYTGLVFVHAGLVPDPDGMHDERVREAVGRVTSDHGARQHGKTRHGEAWNARGAVIAVTRITGCHHAAPASIDGGLCCGEWGDHPWTIERGASPIYHWTLEQAAVVPGPIPWRGALGLRAAPLPLVEKVAASGVLEEYARGVR